MKKIMLDPNELMVAKHTGSALWYKARARGEGGGMTNGSESDNIVGMIAQLAMAKLTDSCCNLLLWKTQGDVEGDVGFEPYCGVCNICTSKYRVQVKATTYPNGHLYVKRSDSRDAQQIYFLGIVNKALTGEVSFVGSITGDRIEESLERYCDIAEAMIKWTPGEDRRRALWIPQKELTPEN